VDGPLRILFIEDVPTEVELAIRQFNQHGVACDWRRVDTEPALREQLASFKPQVVLSDFSMPQLDGWTALTRVHASDPDLPFLFVSGTIGEEGAIEALRHGAMDYVLKGNLARLVPAVQRALREVDLRREQQRAVDSTRRPACIFIPGPAPVGYTLDRWFLCAPRSSAASFQPGRAEGGRFGAPTSLAADRSIGLLVRSA